MRLRALAALVAVVLAMGPATGSYATQPPVPSYYDQLQWNLTSPTARATAISGFANPAMYRMLPGGEGQVNWSTAPNRFGTDNEWGVFLGSKAVGFGIMRSVTLVDSTRPAGVNDMRLSFSGGNKKFTLGLGIGWSAGETGAVGRSDIVQLGLVRRFGRHVSFGAVGNVALNTSYQTGVFDLAVRPLGDARLTLFGDTELAKGIRVSDSPWSVGAMLEIPAGLQLIGRYFDDEAFAFSIGFAFGGLRVTGNPQFDGNDNGTNTNWEIRGGFWEDNFVANALFKDRSYLSLDLHGPVTYREFRWFDARNTLYEILSSINHAAVDPDISGVALSLSGARISRGKAWELREAILAFRKTGKHVIVFVDGVGMTELHIASAADKIVMDPQGIMLIPGYVMGRTFVADMLEKLGVGFDEWRFLTYKSAAEAFSRTSMSEADKEQRLTLLEDLYATVRDDVTAGRNVSAATFEEWVNDNVLISPEQALDMGIVDRLGRWDEVRGLARELEGGDNRFFVGPGFLRANRIPSRTWNENPQVAVVYALGGTQMDSGIRARKLERLFHQLAGNGRVKAVVVRVDSPGGLAIAADVVATAMRKCAQRKPVIVTQGDVAASGGYWVSMNATKVYALPMSIVGSIGVIGGWVWNDGIGEKLGHVADHVSVGENADFGFGIRLLLAGPSIPDRNLTADQRERVLDNLKDSYDQFVGKVAEARGETPEAIERLAQGRVYSGDRALDLGLVDEIGGLDVAIRAAMGLAGLEPDDEVDIVELPALPWFNPALLRPFPSLVSLFGGDADNEFDVDYSNLEWQYLQSIVSAPGMPLYMLPPNIYPNEPRPLTR